jgi:hypothetical protein
MAYKAESNIVRISVYNIYIIHIGVRPGEAGWAAVPPAG